MAERRMFSKTIIDSDIFLDMPISARLLYYDLAMRADDDGFVNSPKKISRITGATSDDLKLLCVKKFVIPFESGLVVIKHWRIHNYIRKDTYTETKYKDEKSQLMLDKNGAYILTSEEQLQVRDEYVTSTSTQVRLGKDSIGKDSEEKTVKKTVFTIFNRISDDYDFSSTIKDKLLEWLHYKKERNESYKEQGLKSLLKQAANQCKDYDDEVICDIIDTSMASNYQGIVWDKLKKIQKKEVNTQDDEGFINPCADWQ